MKILVPGLLVFAIWCYAAAHWYVCNIKYLCDDPVTASAMPPPASDAPTTPDEEMIKIREHETGAVIHFGFDSNIPEDSEVLNAYLQKVTENHSSKSIQITGHTDTTGAEDYNYQLGLERAKAVKNLLVKRGFDAAAITTASKGETESLTNESSAEERHSDRRVEIIIQ